MDAKSLMIGDWVHCITDNSNYKFGRLSRNPECHYTTDGQLNFNYDIKPIPLTEEILKANGFLQGENKFVTKEGFYLNHRDIGFWIRVSDKFLSIDYVHELQHALRLCGLNEFADNFKIKAMEE